MRLERNHHVILRSKLFRIVGAADHDGVLLAIDLQAHTVRLHRRQMGPACDETNIRSDSCQLRTHVTADRTGAVNANFHCRLLDH